MSSEGDGNNNQVLFGEPKMLRKTTNRSRKRTVEGSNGVEIGTVRLGKENHGIHSDSEIGLGEMKAHKKKEGKQTRRPGIVKFALSIARC